MLLFTDGRLFAQIEFSSVKTIQATVPVYCWIHFGLRHLFALKLSV